MLIGLGFQMLVHRSRFAGAYGLRIQVYSRFKGSEFEVKGWGVVGCRVRFKV